MCVCVFTFSDINISETSGPIATKFYLKHHWVEGKEALDFGLDRIRTLVSMATDSSHNYYGENVVNRLAPSFLIGSSYLQVTRTTIISRTRSNLGKIRPRTAELAALERLEKSPLWTYNWKIVVTILAHSFLIESSSFLHITRIYM